MNTPPNLYLLTAIQFLILLNATCAQEKAGPSARTTTPDGEAAVTQPAKVDVAPTANDRAISKRLLGILNATGWYQTPEVEVREGVVFLRGATGKAEHKQWAGELAKNTQDVVAVVNHISVTTHPLLDITPARTEIDSLVREGIQFLPMIGIATIFLLLAWFASGLSFRWSKFALQRRFKSELLSEVSARTIAALAFLFGLYLSLRISGLTQIAATLVGGTGLLGLVFGIAFRDIAENFLASILIRQLICISFELISLNYCVKELREVVALLPERVRHSRLKYQMGD